MSMVVSAEALTERHLHNIQSDPGAQACLQQPELAAAASCTGVAAEPTLRSQATTLCPSSWEA